MNKINKKKSNKGKSKKPWNSNWKSKRNISEEWTRSQSGLSSLTSSFLELLHKSKDGTVDLNKAVQSLNV